MNHRLSALSLAFVSLCAMPAIGQDLVPGKPAPALHVAKWLKGDAVESFAEDRVYVVEFWATWCGPCIEGMPHLSEVQKRHAKDLTVIGVTSEDEANTLADAEAMVKEQGDRMAYTVAWDDGQKTQAAWFEAAGQDGIPTCFVVDKQGVVAWIGHPQWLDLILPDVLAGKYEVKALGEKIEAIEKRMMRIFLAAALKPETALKESEQLLKECPFLTDQVESGLFGMLLEGEGAKLAWPIGERLFARSVAEKDAMSLNGIAWAIVDPEAERSDRNLELAMKAATKAVELTAEKNGSILDTLARVFAWQGNFARALELQRKAVAACGDDQEAADSLRPAIAEYEGKLKETKK